MVNQFEKITPKAVTQKKEGSVTLLNSQLPNLYQGPHGVLKIKE
jgi:hypothetical protein